MSKGYYTKIMSATVAAALSIALIDAVIVGLYVQGTAHPPLAGYGLMLVPFILTLALSFRRNAAPFGALYWTILFVHVAISVYVYLWPFIAATVNGVSTGLNPAVHRLQNNADDNCICPHGVRMLVGCNTKIVSCASCNDGYTLVGQQCEKEARRCKQVRTRRQT